MSDRQVTMSAPRPLHTVIAGHSRSKNGVLSHAYAPAIHEAMQHEKT
jgi:hypothetical protein